MRNFAQSDWLISPSHLVGSLSRSIFCILKNTRRTLSFSSLRIDCKRGRKVWLCESGRRMLIRFEGDQNYFPRDRVRPSLHRASWIKFFKNGGLNVNKDFSFISHLHKRDIRAGIIECGFFQNSRRLSL